MRGVIIGIRNKKHYKVNVAHMSNKTDRQKDYAEVVSCVYPKRNQIESY